MGIALVAGVLIWSSMGNLIVRQKIPSFIITLGGLLIFKGLFWLVIQNSTIPVSRGDEENLYSRLTTYYLPASIGFALAAGAAVASAFLPWRSRPARTGPQLANPTA